MEIKQQYAQAHLVVAMIRILDHRAKTPPTVADVADGLGFTLEHVNFLCLKLKDKGIVDMVQDAYDVRLFIKDHLKIEAFEHEPQDDQMQTALAQFHARSERLD